MDRTIPTVLAVLFSMVAPSTLAAGENIAAIDTYGLVTVSRDTILGAAGIEVGGRVPDAEQIEHIVRKLEKIPGVREADISVVRLRNPGRAPGVPVLPTVYIGIREDGSPNVSFHAAPTANVRLPQEVVDTYEAFDRSFQASKRHGDWSEDDSNGYALLGDEATRTIQKRFIPLSQKHFDRLAEVLRTARSAKHRRIAAAMLPFADDKIKVASELAAAAHDPDAHVRNDAMRALGMILVYAHKHPELEIDASAEPYLDLLESVEWTDRNKAMWVLLGLTEDADDALLTHLAERSLPALAEMARWNTEGHALMAYLLVGRIARLDKADVILAWRDGKREEVIARAFETTSKAGSDEN